MDVFVDLAVAALAVLITVLACYLALRLLGKIAKFIVIVVLIALAVWFIFSDHSILNGVISLSLPQTSTAFC